MKKIYSLFLVAACVFLVQCANRHKITYNIPDSFPEPQRSELVEKIKKGRVLYKEHCAECHGLFSKGKENVPNFTNQQFDNYSMKFLRRDPTNHAVIARMDMQQLYCVIDFLKYKRPLNPDSVVSAPRMR